MPAAVYVTDTDGTITYFNRACVELAGRTPTAGADKWCVTWKLFTVEGDALPHEQCPMAVALREQREIRGARAVAERPDGSRVGFVPYPTPFFAANGGLAGAVNLLLDAPDLHKPEYFRDQASRCRRLAQSTGDSGVAETLTLMAVKYDEQATKLTRRG